MQIVSATDSKRVSWWRCVSVRSAGDRTNFYYGASLFSPLPGNEEKGRFTKLIAALVSYR
jgi:hypothetical protein